STYCRPKGLNRTLESLSKQTRMPDEVIVSDNASPDNTAEIAEKWSPHFNDFRYLRNSENIGMPGNLNNAIAATTGDLIINLHDADVYLPELLEKAEQAMIENDRVGLVFWPAKHNFHLERCIDPVTNGREFFFKHYYLQTSSKIWGTTMVRREAYDKLLPFDPRFKAWADVDMWMRICLDWKIAYLGVPLAEHFVEEGQFRFWNWKKTLLIQDMFFLNIYRHFEGNQIDQNKALNKQLWVLRRLWWRFMIGRIKHAEWQKLFEGPRYFVKYHQMPAIVTSSGNGSKSTALK
ncbi:MAG: glycosyltransferase family 2 protein, partial [Okeania sp. SIO3B3]|nr:glycosyltransferase family 2 protein [Okeania sp. SIO3B3]